MPIKPNDLIHAYQTHFNAAYGALKNKVAALHDSVVTGTSTRIIEAFVHGVAIARAQVAAWNEHVQTAPIAFDEAVARSALAELQVLLLDLVRRKQASPAEALSSATDLEKAIELWQQVILCMQNANAQILSAAGLITTYKGKLATDNVQQLQSQVQQLQASKRRYEPVVVELFAKRVLARKEASTAENKKKAARTKLDEVMKATLKQYEKSINALREIDQRASEEVWGLIQHQGHGREFQRCRSAQRIWPVAQRERRCFRRGAAVLRDNIERG